MATAMEIAFQQAHAATVYAVLGQTVTYEPAQGTASSIVMILDVGNDPFADAYGAQSGEVSITGKVLKANVTQPSRGDKITDGSAVEYTVDAYSELSMTEWSLTLRRCA